MSVETQLAEAYPAKAPATKVYLIIAYFNYEKWKALTDEEHSLAEQLAEALFPEERLPLPGQPDYKPIPQLLGVREVRTFASDIFDRLPDDSGAGIGRSAGGGAGGFATLPLPGADHTRYRGSGRAGGGREGSGGGTAGVCLWLTALQPGERPDECPVCRAFRRRSYGYPGRQHHQPAVRSAIGSVASGS